MCLTRRVNVFQSHTAVVTGAASGIGRALCNRLVGNGATVYAADVDIAGLDALEAQFPVIRIAHVDVTDSDQVGALVARAVGETGRIDFMFNNAGIVVGGDFENMTSDAWNRIVGINLWGVIHGCRHGYEQMLRQGYGHIVNTASSAGVLPVPRSTAYAATKHAVVGLSTSLRAEAASRGIRVSVAIPGLVDTGIFDSAVNLKDYDYSAAMRRVPMGKITPNRAAEYILAGTAKNKQYITFPPANAAIVLLNRMLPNLMSTLVAKQI